MKRARRNRNDSSSVRGQMATQRRWCRPSRKRRRIVLNAEFIFVGTGFIVFLTILYLTSIYPQVSDGLPSVGGRLLQDDSHQTLLHKQLIPLSTRDIVGLVLASMGLMLAAGGGIGGGGILVPIYILIWQFPAKNAIPLSNVTVFGGAVANTILNVRKRHPLADRPLIDWNIIFIMEPLTILGSLVGANLNKLLPERIIVVLLVLLLSLTAYKTLRKARALYQTETYAKLQSREEENHHDENGGNDGNTSGEQSDCIDVELADLKTSFSDTMVPSPATCIPKKAPLTRGVSDSGRPISRRASATFKISNRQTYRFQRSSSLPSPDILRATMDAYSPERKYPKSAESSPNKSMRNRIESESSFGTFSVQDCTNFMDVIQGHARNPSLVRILEKERHAPLSFVCYICSLFIFVLLANILKGGGAFANPLGITCGSASFWMVQAMIALVIVLVSCRARSSLLQQSRLKRDAGYQYLDCDIEWNETSTIWYPIFSCTAGFVAGLFGIGGGIIKGPLMLALGVHPAVASATSACMILFTSFTATTSFAVFGLLVEDYGILGLVTAFIATLLGQTVMSLVLKRHGERHSYIAFCIGGVVLLSAICMTIESVISISKGGGSAGRSNGLCSTHVE